MKKPVGGSYVISSDGVPVPINLTVPEWGVAIGGLPENPASQREAACAAFAQAPMSPIEACLHMASALRDVDSEASSGCAVGV